jgi:hypothetical protein
MSLTISIQPEVWHPPFVLHLASPTGVCDVLWFYSLDGIEE